MTQTERARPAVIVDPYSSGCFYAPAFRARGVPVWAVLSSREPPAPYAGSYRPDDFDRVLVCPENGASGLEAVLAPARPICVLAGCESGVELADRLSPVVSPTFGNVPELAPARRHKGAMAEALAARGVPSIPSLCSADLDEIAVWIERHIPPGGRLVVKPPKSVSTDDVFILHAGADWRERASRILGKPNSLGVRNDAVMAQVCVHGVEYVVDTVSLEGRHSVVAVCRYRKIDNGADNPIYDTMEWVAPGCEEVPPLVDYAFRVLDAVGIRNGPGHVEIMATPTGPLLIEVAARPHGGGNPRFCRIATGDSPVDRTVSCVTSGRLDREGYDLQAHVMIVFLMVRDDVVVRDASALHRVADLETHVFSSIHVRDGDALSKTRDLFSSLSLGIVALADGDEARLRRDYEAIRAAERRMAVPRAEAAGRGG